MSYTPVPTASDLPAILAGPILRQVSPQQVVIWLVCKQHYHLHVKCYQDDTCLHEQYFAPSHLHHIQLAQQAHLHLLILEPEQAFPQDTWLSYDIGLAALETAETLWLQETVPHILYPDECRPRFVIKSYVNQVLHGSCRRPHYSGMDGFVQIDQVLQQTHQIPTDLQQQPALLMLTGDQVYMDDVAGPLLSAIHQIIHVLEFPTELLEGSTLKDSKELHHDQDSYYRRTDLLPDTRSNSQLEKLFFKAARKPIFTSASADNHLISFAEMITMYLLVWSPQLWPLVDLERVQFADEKRATRYQSQLAPLRNFCQTLPQVQRVLANLPVYMIFDDHDITDDWNLSRDWEESAYGNPFSCRIIGNALIAYLLCQGWGNAPAKFSPELISMIRSVIAGEQAAQHNELVQTLIRFNDWHYDIQTQPPIVVLDTRTRRWRAERNPARPSGLLDWEALMDLQQAVLGHQAVILVSAAPIFGVKLIEIAQRIFTWFGYALTVDAENWMAHPGAANVILNIFRHRRTPHHFVILSGDVHYSFVYDVRIRFSPETPHIWQITSSGIHNAFPERLLRFFDRLNRWLFATYSPLNWLTRRRHMRIRQRRPSDYPGRYSHQRLVNGSGIGRVWLDAQGAPEKIEELLANQVCVQFLEGYDSDWVD